MLTFTLLQKAKIVAAPGCVTQIAEVLQDGGYKKPFVIFDQGVKMCGIVDKVTKVLTEAGMEYVEFGDVLPDPPCTVVENAAKLCKDSGCDCVLAIGGGSSIDTGKGVSVMRFNEGTILDFAKPGAEMNYCPGLIAIPTTAGTGAELSNGIIITDPVANVKVPIVGDKAMAQYVLLDAELTVGMPAGLTLATGLDVFSHAMEAYTTILSGPMTDIVCEKLMADVVEFLPRAVANGKDIEARQRMLLCASMGGWMLAHCCAHVGHSLAHTIGAKFHIPHGAACAYAAPATIRFIAPAVPEKMKKVGQILGVAFDGTETPEQIGAKVSARYVEFRDAMNLKPLTDYEITKEAAVALAKDVSVECFAPLTPRKVTEEAAAQMLAELFE
ncbi:MAG: iron-containing alcohol dehydrogenase [archaeon]|nr:iron-containing alcohol dehydrogenase [archaeon]